MCFIWHWSHLNVDLEEFVDGILRCKGQARAIDQVAIHAAPCRNGDMCMGVLCNLQIDMEMGQFVQTL